MVNSSGARAASGGRMSKPLEPIPQERLAIGCAIFLVIWVVILASYVLASIFKSLSDA